MSLAIDRIALRNFLLFTGAREFRHERDNHLNEPFISYGNSFEAEFINGINIFVGANGTGKSTLLKCIYAACEFSNENIDMHKAKRFQDYFSSSKKPISEPGLNQGSDNWGLVEVFSGENEFLCRTFASGALALDRWRGLDIKSVLIPSMEMLSHSDGLIAMASKYGIPFDQTQIDILVNAQLWGTNEISDRNKKLLDRIGTVIDGEVVFENDTFYVQKNNGFKVEFSLEAEGFKKLGLLWRLIRHGHLESGSVLLWDEPDASMNPELMPLLADILYTLKDDGVQIFLATHSYMLAKHLDIRQRDDQDVLFISLSKNATGEIEAYQSHRYAELAHNPIETAEENLYNAIVRKSFED